MLLGAFVFLVSLDSSKRDARCEERSSTRHPQEGATTELGI